MIWEILLISFWILLSSQSCTESPSGHYLIKTCENGTQEFSGCLVDQVKLHLNEVTVTGDNEITCAGDARSVRLQATGCVIDGNVIHIGDSYQGKNFEHFCTATSGVHLIIVGCILYNLSIPLNETRLIFKYRWACSDKGPRVSGCLLGNSILNLTEEGVQGNRALRCTPRGLQMSACAFNNTIVPVNGTYIHDSFEFICKKVQKRIRPKVHACLIQNEFIPVEGSRSIGNYEYTCVPDRGLDITGCSKDNITAGINETLSDGTFSYICKHSGRQVELEINGCYQDTNFIALGEATVIDGIKYSCSERGTIISGCSYHGKQLLPGETEQTDDYVLKCEKHNDSTTRLVVTACIHDGNVVNVGQGFTQDMNDYLCFKDKIKGVSIIMNGCTIGGKKLKSGDRQVKQNMVYECSENGPVITACMRRNEELRIGQKRLEENYEIICKKDPLSGSVAISVFSCLLRDENGDIETKILLGEQLVWNDSLYECAVESIDTIGE